MDHILQPKKIWVKVKLEGIYGGGGGDMGREKQIGREISQRIKHRYFQALEKIYGNPTSMSQKVKAGQNLWEFRAQS